MPRQDPQATCVRDGVCDEVHLVLDREQLGKFSVEGFTDPRDRTVVGEAEETDLTC